MKSAEIRKKFSDFFVKNAHEKIASSSLVPNNDPTLLFANAGMNQFKDFFTGKSTPKNRRAVTIQKCVRAGGKHNDLENVGHTARHHTFFEMLGNFSFGDYFKNDAIRFAWDFLTKELGMDKDRLYITVHYSDDEALNIWHRDIGIPLERIFKKGDKDNFWEMGEFGPCGPCSEIFYDYGEKYATPNFKPKEGQDLLDDELRYVEIWNLVFMQFEKTKEGQISLPKPSIDTGAGLERLATALQGKYWNYDTDLFQPIITSIEKISRKKYTDGEYTSAMRVVSDHIRSATMLITDGIIPSNEGRGYVLRRIIRRAVRHLKELEAPAGSFSKLIPSVFEVLGEEYPQNKANQDLATKLLEIEERKFLETLDQGLKFLEESIKKDLKNNVLPGKSVFKLYDTFGFPVDLTEIILEEKGFKADSKGFDELMQKRKEESKKSWKGGEGLDNKIFYDEKEKHGKTTFTGYEKLTDKAKLLSIIPLGELSALVFDRTPFYGESGGQVGDKGIIQQDGATLSHITDTQKPVDDFFIHLTNEADALEIGKTYDLVVDNTTRSATMKNHSATHLLQAALIEVLGNHVKQAGSIVTDEKLRFDFTHMQAMTKEEIKRVEEIVNQKIEEALPVSANIMSKDAAIKKGAQALFGEKYGSEVRVMEMGAYSLELCGGTHVHNTSDIGLFIILTEASLSTGVRRIEAITSHNALKRLQDRSEYLDEIEHLTSLKDKKAVERVETVLKELRTKEKEIQKLNEKVQSLQGKEIFSNLEKIGAGFQFKAAQAPDGSDLRKLSDQFLSQTPEGIVLLYSSKGNKTAALLRCSKSNSKIDCGKILNTGLAFLNGRGGGKKDMAQGSGDPGDLGKFVSIVKEELEKALS